MLKKLSFIFILSLAFFSNVQSQSYSSHKFKAGESLTYGLYYYLWGVWVGAGEVTFTIDQSEIFGKPCYMFKGYGTTYSKYDWFYKVEDTYMAYSSLDQLKPYRFHRNINEGSTHYIEDNVYDYPNSKILSTLKVKGKELERDTLSLEPNSFDVLTLIYHTRDIDFSKYKKDDKIPIRMVIDRETFDLYIRFLGADIYDHSEFGKIECYVFSPLLVDGSIFKSGEKMKVWVTKDQNVVPIYIQSEIRVGSIRSELKSYSGLKSGKLESID